VLSACAAFAIADVAGLLGGCAQLAPAQSASPTPQAANLASGSTAQTSQASTAATPAAASGQQSKLPSEADSKTGVGPEKQQIAGECAQLLKMATALKTEIDKTTKDTLSVAVVRQADQIEQLAHKVRAGTGKE